MTTGFNFVLQKLANLTTEPGCYLMKDHEGVIFYIGKAKNLKARLKSYFQGTDTRIFVQFLENILADIDLLVVRNDIEALVLERELIKKHKPRFNIMLKDDKNYILLKLMRPKEQGRKRDRFPRLEVVRRVKKDGARYFGPYPSAKRLRTTIELINKYFMLRTCRDAVIENRSRPCIQYQIGRCWAPCVYEISNYDQEIDNIMLFLSGNYREIEQRLTKKMRALSEAEQFEGAAKVRDQIEAIHTSLTSQVVTEVNQQRNQDIIGLARNGPEIEIVQILIRNGTWHMSHNFAFSDQPFPSEEILRAFVHQAYAEIQPSNIPHDIMLNLAISQDLAALGAVLKEKAGRNVTIFCPTKGKALRLVHIAQKNAELALGQRIQQQSAHIKAVEALQKKLELTMRPERIECMDISLIQGQEPFGSCVVFIDGKPDKTLYRIFKIKTVTGMDDFAMINEVVNRRIKAGIKDGNLPDLLLIDGGRGQLSAALKAIDDNNLLVSKDGFYVAGIAKARTLKETGPLQNTDVEHSSERLFIPHESTPILLEPHTYERYLVERIRDEAHRFALSAHRRGRSKRVLSSALLTIPGIGKTRALKLLKQFGSVKMIHEAKPEDIARCIKVSLIKAEEILRAIAESTL